MVNSLRVRWVCGVALVALVALGAVPPCMGQSEAQSAARDNIVVVLDASGSMREKMSGQSTSRMQIAQQALSEVLRTLPPTAHIGVLVFSGVETSGESMREHWVYPLGPIDAERLNAAIRRVKPAGNTPLGEYMKIGADELLKRRTAQRGFGSFRLLVVSDGEASDKALVDRYLPDLMTRGIVVDVIGVDMKSDHALATKVHNYRRANDPVALQKAVAASIAEIGAVRDVGADAEAYAAVAALPEGLVNEVLKTLSAVHDTPIGESPPRKVAPVDTVTPPPAPSSSSGSAPSSPAVQVPPPGDGDSNRGLSGWVWFGIGFFVILLLRRGMRRGPRGH
ncbi:MAG: vWA domain-containing protein [Planctomycetota bacterium]